MRAPAARIAVALTLWAGLQGAGAPAASARVLAGGRAAHAKHRRRRPPKPTVQPVSVTLATGEPRAAVPGEFLGLSFEASSLSAIADDGERGDLVGLLRSLGPGVLRFGGVTADEQVAWNNGLTPRPEWASSVIEPSDLQRLAALAARSGWRVLLTIGLVHFEPAAAASEAAAAQAILGPSLEAIELGNEPNAYAKHGFRSEPWTFVQYEEQVAAYRSAIEAAAPGIPLAGPDVSGASAFESWGLGEAVDLKPLLLTGHHYPLGCSGRVPATIANLLSPHTRRLGALSLEAYASIARQAEIPFRLDEANTVSCGGTAGVSDTFASALWASGYIAEAMDAGVAGINLQGNPTNCSGYTPLCSPSAEALAAGALAAQPEWYALLLARQLIGDRPVPAVFHAVGHPNIAVAAMLGPEGALKLLVLDYEAPGVLPLRLSVRVGARFGGARVLTLSGPSPSALTGVILGGAPVSAAGTWQPAELPRSANRHGVITTTVQPASAALLTIAPAHARPVPSK
jgi:hypothetical protein